MQSIRVAVVACFCLLGTAAAAKEEWPQLKFDCRRSGNVPERAVTGPFGLLGVVPLTDAVFTAPVVADGRVYVVDGAGVAFGIDAATLEVTWRRETRGGPGNCSNVSSPAIAGAYLHFGTMGGSHYVLRLTDGEVVKEIRCGEPIFSAPVVANGRVYVVTLGSHVYALEPDGTLCWEWDYLKEQRGFSGDRFSGKAWADHKGGHVTTADQFCCAWDAAAVGKRLVVPAGGAVVWLEDGGSQATVKAVQHPRTPTLGLSIGDDDTVYRQWHRLDNGGRVETLRIKGDVVEAGFVPGTQTSTRGGALSFCSVSLRGRDVYQCRPEENFALCRHTPDSRAPESLGGYPAIASPILLRDHAVYGGLDGRLYVVPLKRGGASWSFKTAFGKAISAPVAVCDGRVYFGCDDGHLYVLGRSGSSPRLATERPDLVTIRSPLTSPLRDSRNDWFTSFGNWGNTNVTKQVVKPPFRVKWVRRFAGSTKHFSTCGGGRVYTHTAEGQIFAVEQETGRLLWRRYYPGVHICYTSPLYYKERVLVPQAGLKRCRLRCLDAATGELFWEAPFAGSPSWNRQLPPIVHETKGGAVAIYAHSTGRYKADQWLTNHGEVPGFPKDQKPLVRAFDLGTGKEVWTVDFSRYGTGGDDGGLCLMDGTLYYSCFLGYLRRETPRATGVTAALDPSSGRILWVTTKHAVHSGCTISGEDGRLYMGGYSKVDARNSRVWCLNARDGSLLWQSEPVSMAINVITVGERFLFTHAQYQNGYLIDKTNGKILHTLTKGYKCTRFTLAEPYLLGTNMDVYDLTNPGAIKLVSTGPAVDPSMCLGATISNGRMFYTSHGSGLQLSQVGAAEAATAPPPWASLKKN